MADPNPFKAGRYSGTQLYPLSAEDRIHVVKDFDRAACNAALLVPGLQKTVAAAVKRRLRYLDKVAAILEFEDHGQDFLRWELDAKGNVIGCEPFQASQWVGGMVLGFRELKVGDAPVFARSDKDGRFSGGHMRYPLEKVTFTKGVQA